MSAVNIPIHQYADHPGGAHMRTIVGENANYVIAHNTATRLLDDLDEGQMSVGIGPGTCRRGVMAFNTGMIPDDAVISNVRMFCFLSSAGADQSHIVRIHKLNWLAMCSLSQVGVAPNMDAIYDAILTAPLDQALATITNATVISSPGEGIWLESPPLDIAWVSCVGPTCYALVTNRDIAVEAPVDYGAFMLSDAAHMPYLRVTYTSLMTAASSSIWPIVLPEVRPIVHPAVK